MLEFLSTHLSEFNAIGLFSVTCLMLFVIYNQNKVIKLVESLSHIALDTYKGHHEHILLANRDKNCCEEVSSKTDPKFIREIKKNGKPGAFIPQDRKAHGPCIKTEANG